jgi:hypothetical protein
MMAFSTASSSSVLERLRRGLLALLLCVAGAVSGAEIEITNPQLVASDDGYVLSADFTFDLNERLEDAVSKGLVLHFVTEFVLTRPRWYWLDETLVRSSQTYRLSYHALTRQYRLTTGGLHQSFDSLSDALRVLRRLRNWEVVEKGDGSGVRPGETYVAALRLRLDISQLPRPFQISALGNRDWSLASDWKTWQVTIPVEAR